MTFKDLIRNNIDVVAITVLIGGIVLSSQARKIVICDLFSHRTVVLQKAISGPEIDIISPLPAFSFSTIR